MNNAEKRYLAQLFSAVFAYAVVLIGMVVVIIIYPSAPWRFMVVLAPMIPAAFILAAFVQYLGRMDELQRRIQLAALAIGFGATAILTFGYGFLQLVGLPQISYLFVWPVMGICWGIGVVIASRRCR